MGFLLDMKLYRITTCNYANDLSGEGAYLYGGRWNSKGTRLLYTAESSALAMLEALAHITMVHQKRAYCKVVLDCSGLVPHQPGGADSDFFKSVSVNELPQHWRNNPGPDALKQFGDDFIKEGKCLGLKVPSVLDPDSCNYLINPNHALFAELKIHSISPVSFDQRFLKR
jgi:RES domain-containing protein